MLTLVGHPDRDHPDQIARLTSARRFVEESNGHIKWLLVLDDVDSEAVAFLKEHLPRNNSSGNILFTTRMAAVADAFTDAKGQYQTFKLRAPNVNNAAQLLPGEAGIDTGNTMSSPMDRAKELVKCIVCFAR